MKEVYDFLKKCGTYYLATVDGDQPKLRPLGAHLEMDGKVLFGIGDFKDVYKQLLKNPKCEIAAAKQDGHWLRYTGRAVFETDPKYAQALLDANPSALSQREGDIPSGGYYVRTAPSDWDDHYIDAKVGRLWFWYSEF